MLEWRIGYTLIEVVKLNNKFQFDIHTYSILPNVARLERRMCVCACLESMCAIDNAYDVYEYVLLCV